MELNNNLPFGSFGFSLATGWCDLPSWWFLRNLT